MRKRLLILACMILAILITISCDKNKDSGSGGGQSVAEETVSGKGAVIKGLTTVSARGQVTYRALIYPKGAEVVEWRWQVQGHGSIVGEDNRSTVTVDISGLEGGGEYTLSLKVKLAKSGWVGARDFKVTVSPYPRFQVVVNNAVQGSLNPTSQTGDGTMTSSQEFIQYQSWTLYFTGDVSTFPDLINVRVATSNGCAICPTNWANGVGAQISLDFPKQGGGTVGNGGTVYDAGANRPDLRTQTGNNYNYLFLRADGVQDMELLVHR